ncbi:MAG: F0F1 ATP synthase subunit delta [Candidatus Omnitrophica bacterium]|nr:F0F1 ATP synthase subunit delta [Candidatus Omnitrophota bacterium]
MSPTLIIPFVLLQIATVVAIVLFLRMLLHKQLEVGLRRIKKLDKENLAKEASLNEKIETIAKEYGVKVSQAEKEAVEIINAAKEESKKVRDTARVRAKEEAKRIIASSMQEKERVMKEADREIARQAVDSAALILRRVFSDEELSGLRSGISKDVIETLLEADNVRALISKNKDMEIITADKLSKQDEEYILKIIKKNSEEEKKVLFSMDKNVLGGLILKIGESIIDGGVAYRLQKAVLEMKEEIL